jgi:hypothetical protein
MKENWMWYAKKRRKILRGILWKNPALGWSTINRRVLLKCSLKKQNVFVLK